MTLYPRRNRCTAMVADGGRKALPVRSAKTIFFTWSIKDPADVEGSPDVAHAAFESACQSLEAHIKELVGAILEEPQTDTRT